MTAAPHINRAYASSLDRGRRLFDEVLADDRAMSNIKVIIEVALASGVASTERRALHRAIVRLAHARGADGTRKALQDVAAIAIAIAGGIPLAPPNSKAPKPKATHRAKVGVDERRRRMVDFVAGHGDCTRFEIEAAVRADVTSWTISKDLLALVDDGELVRTAPPRGFGGDRPSPSYTYRIADSS